MRAGAAFWAPWRRSVRFAAQLASRHGATRDRRPAAGRVFLRPATAPVWWALVRLRARTDIVLARVSRLSSPTRQPRDHDIATLVLTRAAIAAPAVVPVASIASRAVAEAARLMVRATRVEGVDGRPTLHVPSVVVASPVDNGRVTVPGASRAARVLRRTMPAQPPAERADPGWGTPSAAPKLLQAMTFPPAELDRVAEHVIQTMDRRLRAHRERHGRN